MVITVPDDVAVEVVDRGTVAGWAEAGLSASQHFARTWFDERRTAVLRVPSVIAPQHEWNAVINPAHPDTLRIGRGEVEPVQWDERIFSGRATAQ